MADEIDYETLATARLVEMARDGDRDAAGELLLRDIKSAPPVERSSNIPVKVDERGVTAFKDGASVSLDPIGRSVSAEKVWKISPKLSVQGTGSVSKGNRQAGVALHGRWGGKRKR